MLSQWLLILVMVAEISNLLSDPLYAKGGENVWAPGQLIMGQHGDYQKKA